VIPKKTSLENEFSLILQRLELYSEMTFNFSAYYPKIQKLGA